MIVTRIYRHIQGEQEVFLRTGSIPTDRALVTENSSTQQRCPHTYGNSKTKMNHMKSSGVLKAGRKNLTQPQENVGCV